ncbi:unnamed protein product, partial [Rotaria sordida]
CDPCKNIARSIEKLYADIENYLNDVLHHSITYTPMFIFIQNSQEVDRLENFNEQYIEQTITKFLS